MGMEQTVLLPSGVPTWDAISTLLTDCNFPVQLRMIDGELAFPDEKPAENWHELRVGTSQGMITLRRELDHIAVITWGNADRPMLQAWNALAWACAQASGGTVVRGQGSDPAEEFRRTADLPDGIRN
jgi:hypothetical protein